MDVGVWMPASDRSPHLTPPHPLAINTSLRMKSRTEVRFLFGSA